MSIVDCLSSSPSSAQSPQTTAAITPHSSSMLLRGRSAATFKSPTPAPAPDLHGEPAVPQATTSVPSIPVAIARRPHIHSPNSKTYSPTTLKFHIHRTRTISASASVLVPAKIAASAESIPPVLPAATPRLPHVRTLHTSKPLEDEEVVFENGDITEVVDTNEHGAWWRSLLKGKARIVPFNFVVCIR